jgi:hypothetical protein
MAVPDHILTAVAKKQMTDELEFTRIAAKLDRKEGGKQTVPVAEPAAMLANAAPVAPVQAPAAPAPMSVAAAPVSLEPTPEPPAAAAPAAPAVVAPPVANAYAPAPRQNRGFFSRVLDKVNPF